ncbi:DUF6243 family protein, partial [Streptomyces albidoflavus]
MAKSRNNLLGVGGQRNKLPRRPRHPGRPHRRRRRRRVRPRARRPP